VWRYDRPLDRSSDENGVSRDLSTSKAGRLKSSRFLQKRAGVFRPRSEKGVHLDGLAIFLECRSCRVRVTFSNSLSWATHGSNRGSDKGPIRIASDYLQHSKESLYCNKLLKIGYLYISHGGSRRFESCCAHHINHCICLVCGFSIFRQIANSSPFVTN
jgi:hypothetical protein